MIRSTAAGLRQSGRLIAARQTGDVIRLVLGAGLPSLPFVQPGHGRTYHQALAANRRLVRATTADAWLPRMSDGAGSTTEMVDCADVALPDDDAGLGTLAVVGFAATAPDDPSVSAVATSSTTAYLSSDALFVAASPVALPMTCCVAGPIPAPSSQAQSPSQSVSLRVTPNAARAGGCCAGLGRCGCAMSSWAP